MKVNHYISPYGKESVVSITQIRLADEEFFINNDISCSMEVIGNDMVVLYATLDHISEILGEEWSTMITVNMNNHSCSDSFNKLAESCKGLLKTANTALNMENRQ